MDRNRLTVSTLYLRYTFTWLTNFLVISKTSTSTHGSCILVFQCLVPFSDRYWNHFFWFASLVHIEITFYFSSTSWLSSVSQILVSTEMKMLKKQSLYPSLPIFNWFFINLFLGLLHTLRDTRWNLLSDHQTAYQQQICQTVGFSNFLLYIYGLMAMIAQLSVCCNL